MNNFLNQQYPMNYSQPKAPQTNGINWVQGIEGAKAFQLYPNSNALLMDSENEGIFYIKVSDNIGMCNLRRFSYTELTDDFTTANNIDMSQYITRAEVEEMIGGLKHEQSIQSAKSKSNTNKRITE